MLEIICVALGIALFIAVFDGFSRLADELPSGCGYLLLFIAVVIIYGVLFR